jgi:hypothetical protein
MQKGEEMTSGTKLIVLILGMWVCATVGAVVLNNIDPFVIAGLVSVIFGFGYASIK